MSYKFLKTKNPKIISRLKKFSNIELFSRRESELLQKINSNKMLPIKTENIIKKKEDPKVDIDLSEYALKTISSFKTSFDFLTSQIGINKNNINKNQNKKVKNNNQKNLFPYNKTLTEFNTNEKIKKFKNNKFFSTNDIRNHNNNILINYLKTINDFHFKTISNSNSNNNILYMKEKDYKIDLLKELQIKNVKNEKKINKKRISLLNSKQKKFHVTKKSVKDMLNQTRELKLFKFTQNKKKEINLRMQEVYQNKQEYIDDKINTLKIGTNLYDMKFANKYAEYYKFILYYKDEEKRKCDMLENNKNKYKKEIMLLQNKIKKEEMEKNTILRWIYFQIKMKEKKLILPEYYQKIIEEKIKRNIVRRKTIAPEIKNIKMIKEAQKLYNVNSKLSNYSKGVSSKNLLLISNKTNDEVDIYSEKNIMNKIIRKNTDVKSNKNIIKKIVKFTENNFNNNNQNNINNIINFEDDNKSNETLQNLHKNIDETGIDGYEISRINQYKLFLIYKTPEDFEDRLHEFENENIQLLEQYNSLQKQLNKLKMYYIKIKNEKNENNIYILNRIKLKEYELKEEIKRNELLKNQISDMKKGKYFIRKNNNFSNKYKKKKYKQNNNDSTSFSLGKQLYLRVLNLYNLFQKNYSETNEKTIKFNNYKEEIIYMLSYIERKIDMLEDKFSVYNKSDYSNYELMRKIKNDIEKRHKIQKGEMLRSKEKAKFIKFQEEIERKINRIIFIQRRKTNSKYDMKKIGKNKEYNSYGENKNEPNFEDFMFDKNEFINFENNI